MFMKKTSPERMRIIPALGAALLLFAAAAPGGTDILAGLGLTRASAGEGILEALISGTPYHEAAMKAFKALPAASRAAAVSAGLDWIKAFAGSREFAAAYALGREKERPAPPVPRPAADEQAKKMKADMEKSIAEMRKGMAAMDAETKKVMEASIRGMREQLERMEADPQQKALWRQMADMAGLEDKKRHEEELKAWEEGWPADPRVLIRRRINDFLVVSAGVDFAARVKPRGDKMIFVNEEYEQKPPEWKVCFRAGKEATAAARAFAAAWLAEIEKAVVPGR
jgi:hypothetical protein